MADYTALTSDSLLPGEPITSAKVNALYENPLAIAEGAVGAPPIQTAAMAGSLAGTNMLFGLGGADVIYTAGEEVTFFPDANFRCIASCQVRVQMQIRSTGTAAGTTYIYKNGNIALQSSANSTSFQFVSVDITMLPGTIVRIAAKGEDPGGSGDECEIRDIQYLVGDDIVAGCV